jgi:flagellar hook-basal body complex protein FliE
MSNMQVDSVLSQIRSLSSQLNGGGIRDVAQTQNTPGSFSSLMKSGIDQVNQSQQRANDLATGFERGTPGIELPQVMLEMQKANVSFRALTEVRNRFVSAYQEIMNMQI